jgi:hypothetical protein
VNEGHPAIVIDLDDPYDLGREFFRWEFATAIAGVVLGINPFDESNVQESKDNTMRVLKDFESSGSLLYDRRDANMPGSDVDALLSCLGSGNYLGIAAFIPETDNANARLGDVRRQVRDAHGVAATLGYGPRFLHSTGQLHKGGPPQGVFLQLTSDDRDDASIPGRSYTFGQLKRAQAIGDFESLRGHGRPVLNFHLGVDAEEGLALLARQVESALFGPVAARR